MKFLSNRRIKFLFFWIFLLSADTASQMMLKIGARGVSKDTWINIWIICGYLTYFLSFAAWMQILRTTRLSIALAMASLLYITITIVSHLFLNEIVTLPIIIGTSFITIGVFILGFNEGIKEEKAGSN